MFDRVMTAKESFESFSTKYPFLCISDSSTDVEKLKAESRYPSDIGLNIYIGNFVNCMNIDHLKKLGIT